VPTKSYDHSYGFGGAIPAAPVAGGPAASLAGGALFFQ